LHGEVYKLAYHCQFLKRYEDARRLYQRVLDTWPESEYAIQAQSRLVMLYIDLGNDPNAQAELDKLIADFNDHPKLPETVIEIGLKYYSKAHYSEADGNDERAAQYYLKAIAVWERVLAEFPPSASYTPRAYYISAVVYSQELRRYA